MSHSREKVTMVEMTELMEKKKSTMVKKKTNQSRPFQTLIAQISISPQKWRKLLSLSRERKLRHRRARISSKSPLWQLTQLDQALTKSTEVLSSKWAEFEAKHIDVLTGVAQRITKLKELSERTAIGATASSAPVSAQPDTRQWPSRNNIGQVPSVALIIPNIASWSQISMIVEIDFTNFSMSELHFCQLALMKEIREWDSYTHM